MSLEDIKFWQVVENFFFSSAVQSYGNFIAVFEFSTNFFKKNLTRKQKTGRQQAKIRPSSGNFRGKTQRCHAQDAGEILSDERQIIVNFGVFGSFPLSVQMQTKEGSYTLLWLLLSMYQRKYYMYQLIKPVDMI